MKILTALCMGLAVTVMPLVAQDNPPPRPGANAPGQEGAPPQWKKHGKRPGPPPEAALTPDEQKRLAAAREKAKEDPTVRSLREAKEKLDEQLETAMHAAMLSADSTLAPTLEKIKQARTHARETLGKFESLTPAQREQLKAARAAVKDDPAVQAAREKMRAADGPEARREAAKETHKAVKAAMLKADPSLAPLLEKLGPGAMGPGPMDRRGRMGGGPGGPPPGHPGEPDGE